MFNIDKYLGKFKKNLNSNTTNTEIIIEIVKQITGIILKKEKIEIKDGVLYIKDSPLIKNKIFINKNKLIKSLSENIEQKIIDIM